jgi:hypothetical protein
MANIFSGLFSGGGGSDASALARQKDALERYNALMEYKERNEDIIDQIPAFDKAIANMSPERKSQMELFRQMAGGMMTGDKGQEAINAGFKQRGTTIADMLKGNVDVDVHKQKRDYDIANPLPTDDASKIAVAKAYVGPAEFNRLANSSDPADREKLQGLMRDAWRDRQVVDTGTTYEGVFGNLRIEKNLIQEGVDKAGAPIIGERLRSFHSNITETETFLEQSATQRERIQELYKTAEGNTGWWAIASTLPDVGTETGSRAWKELRDTIVANIGLDKILDLKASSAQGATGLGALNEKELEMLQKHKGSLEQANTPEELKKVLLRMDKDLDRLQKDKLKALGQERSWYNRNRRYIGQKPTDPDHVPEYQEYLFKGGAYVPRQGESPLEEKSGNVFDDAENYLKSN